MTRAYKLEQSAFQPIIIIDPGAKVQEYFLDEEQCGAFSSDGSHTYNLFAKTIDERLFIDFLSSDACTNPKYRPLDVFAEEEVPGMLDEFAVHPSDTLDVSDKKCWLQRYARGDWRAHTGGEFEEVNFLPRTEKARRRLVPGNFMQDFS